MDLSPSDSKIPNRRSFPNLSHLSLAPLSSRFPIDDEGYDDNKNALEAVTSSYLQGRSAPTTPRILAGGKSKSKSKSKSKKSKYEQDSYFPPQGLTFGQPMIKAKSSSALASQLQHLGLLDGQNASLLSRSSSRPLTQKDDDEWFHRAGVVIASETRESKGQAWLTTRDSSTSLVHHAEYEDKPIHRKASSDSGGSAHLSGAGSRIHSRPQSRAHSRVPSARTSRRGSRTGSRNQIAPLEGFSTAAYLEAAIAMEPDFVENEDEEGTAAEAEVQRLSQIQGFGFGGLVDRLVGMSLFNVDEDSEDEEKVKAEETEEEQQRRRQRALKKRREELARAALNSANATAPKIVVVEPPKQTYTDQEGGWNDVAWLLSVASKVIL